MRIKYLPLLFTAAVILGFIAGMRVKEVPFVISADKTNLRQTGSRWQKVQKLIERYHPNGHAADSLETVILDKILNQLDPYSQFIPYDSKHYQNGKLNGIGTHWGVEAIRNKDTLFVLSVEKGSPLELEGVLPGDQLLMEEGKIKWLGHFDDLKLLNVPTESSFDLQSCMSAVATENDRLYIRIHSFRPDTYRTFMEILEQNPKAREQLIIDLRGNSGGEIEQALQIANQFIDEKGEVLLRMQLASDKEKTYKSSGNTFFTPGKITVLIDHRTASSAEILAGILQTQGVARIVGTKSKGKCALMKQFELAEGVLHLQTGNYSIEGLPAFGRDSGVVPDLSITTGKDQLQMLKPQARKELLSAYMAFYREQKARLSKEEIFHGWLGECLPYERSIWLEIMAPHLDDTLLFKLMQAYDPYFQNLNRFK